MKFNKEELDLLVKKYYYTKDNSYKEEIIKILLPLIKYLAIKNGNINDLEDLTQIGVLGLLKALERFDINKLEMNKNSNFLNFAIPTIVGEIKKYYRDHHYLIRMPRDIYDNYFKIAKGINFLRARLKREPTIKEISDYVNIPPEKIVEFLEFEKNKKSLSIEYEYQNENKYNLGYFIEDKSSKIDNDTKIDIQNAVNSLDPIEKMVINLRFFEGLTQEEIAKKLNTIQVKISRIQAKALQKLKEYFLK
ncbi:MAG: sigma-70 family RNA polymerase sigma factor [bacterium]|nr:sigma-70 family RNA polymerase sigma factor [bacterium]